jgi:hypothetical protein
MPAPLACLEGWIYWLVLVLPPDEEPPCCGRTVVELVPEFDVLPLELPLTSVRLRVETVPVVSGALDRVRLVDTFTSLERRCSTETPTLGEVSCVRRIVVRRLTETLGSLTSS